MAKLGEPVHPNVMAAVMAPRARELAANIEVARARKAEMAGKRAAGRSAVDIAKHFGISVRRVRQILKKWGHSTSELRTAGSIPGLQQASGRI